MAKVFVQFEPKWSLTHAPSGAQCKGPAWTRWPYNALETYDGCAASRHIRCTS